MWPQLGTIAPALARPTARPADGRPVPGLLDITLPWTTLAGQTGTPGLLGRIGPITATQARRLAAAADTDPDAQWRIIVTNPAGQAIAVTRIRRRARASPRDPRDLAADGPPGNGPPGAGLAGRITLTITQHTITAAGQAAGPGPPSGAGPSQGKSARRGRSAGPDRPAGRHQPRHHHHTTAPDHRRRAAGRHRGPRPGARPRPGRPGRRRMRPHRPVTGLPATTPAARTRHRPGRHLPQPGLPPARLARRPRPHPPLRPTRPHLRLQPRRHLPQPPPAQTTPPLDTPANHTRPLHLDHTRRTHLHHRTRHVCHLTKADNRHYEVDVSPFGL